MYAKKRAICALYKFFLYVLVLAFYLFDSKDNVFVRLGMAADFSLGYRCL